MAADLFQNPATGHVASLVVQEPDGETWTLKTNGSVAAGADIVVSAQRFQMVSKATLGITVPSAVSFDVYLDLGSGHFYKYSTVTFAGAGDQLIQLPAFATLKLVASATIANGVYIDVLASY